MLTGTMTRRTQLDSGYWQYVRIMLVSSYSHIENSANSLHEKQNVGSATRVLLTNLYWQNYRPCTVQYWWSCSFKCQNPYLVRIQGMKNIETIFETFVVIVFHSRTGFSCIGQFLSINSLGFFFVCFFTQLSFCFSWSTTLSSDKASRLLETLFFVFKFRAFFCLQSNLRTVLIRFLAELDRSTIAKKIWLPIQPRNFGSRVTVRLPARPSVLTTGKPM